MITTKRKSKYKHKITMPNSWASDNQAIRTWCEQSFGPGGRKQRWRFGWTGSDNTFYFRNEKDALLFVLRWTK